MKYTVTLPDGSVKARNSRRAYTHALACRKGERWGVISFCGSLALASKEHGKWTSRNPLLRDEDRSDEYRILPVHSS